MKKGYIAITPSTGGLQSTNHIVGRDEIIKDFWKVLKTQSIALFAERRFGKSSILRKMADETPKGFIFLYIPVEGDKTLNSFTDKLITHSHEKKLINKKLKTRLTQIWNGLAYIEVHGVKLKKITHDWQKSIFELFKTILETNNDKIVIFALDEFSIFLSELSADDAKSVLGFFRDITHSPEFKNLRFIYNGSIGIDLVLDKLKIDKRNIGNPLSHMRRMDLPPLTPKNAQYFGNCLKKGLEIKITQKLIENICIEADNIPYFIDIIFDKISKNKTVLQQHIDDALIEILNDTTSKNNINHFYDRISDFYPRPEIAIVVLNHISKNKDFTSERSIISNTNSTINHNYNDIIIKDEIERLKNDGYLIRKHANDERMYDFKYKLLKKWWKINKA